MHSNRKRRTVSGLSKAAVRMTAVFLFLLIAAIPAFAGDDPVLQVGMPDDHSVYKPDQTGLSGMTGWDMINMFMILAAGDSGLISGDVVVGQGTVTATNGTNGTSATNAGVQGTNGSAGAPGASAQLANGNSSSSVEIVNGEAVRTASSYADYIAAYGPVTYGSMTAHNQYGGTLLSSFQNINSIQGSPFLQAFFNQEFDHIARTGVSAYAGN